MIYPSKHVIFHRKLLVYQRVWHFTPSCLHKWWLMLIYPHDISRYRTGVSAPEEQLRGVQLKVGTFPKFREMYRKWGTSVLVEKGNREEPRDVFQFVCGMCWQYFIELEDMASKVGVVFLVYLLFHTQYHSRYAIPVTIDLLQQLTVLRDQCVAQEIFLELPAVLREMAQKDLFSVGLRATCRSLWFDRHGHLIERQVSKAKSAQSTLVTIQRPPDLTNLQKKVAASWVCPVTVIFCLGLRDGANPRQGEHLPRLCLFQCS